MPAPVRLNTYRRRGKIVYLDVGSKAHPNAVTVIDAADLPKVLDGRGRWYAYQSSGRPQVYVRRSITLKRAPHGTPGRQGYEMLHRLLARTAENPLVIHIDHDGLNNRRHNLKATTPEVMAAHARHAKKKKYRGVFKRSGSNRFRAIIGMDGRAVRLGSFSTAIEAARAYDVAARKRYGDLARLNFPESANA